MYEDSMIYEDSNNPNNNTPSHCSRDIPMPLVSSGVDHGNLRELALKRMEDLGTQCRDIRTREVGIQEIHNKVKPYEVGHCLRCHVLIQYHVLVVLALVVFVYVYKE